MLFFGFEVSSIHIFEIFSVLLNKYTIYFVLSSSIYRCNVSLRGNGLKVLTANSYIPCDTAVIECRGKYMLNNPGLNKVMRIILYYTFSIFLVQASRSNPYVLQHRLGSDLEVLVDGTTYGNDSR